MANAIYPLWKQSVMAGDANSDLDTNTTDDGVYAALVDTGTYTYSAAHQFYSSVTGVIGTPQRILSPTVVNGVFDGDNITNTAVSGASAEAFVFYRRNSGARSTWRLVAFIDTGFTNLPVTPNGGDITTTWNATGIFAL